MSIGPAPHVNTPLEELGLALEKIRVPATVISEGMTEHPAVVADAILDAVTTARAQLQEAERAEGLAALDRERAG